MTIIKKGDFIELDYAGRTGEGMLFDTTIEEVAKKEHFHNRKVFRPVIVCVGEGHLLSGLDQHIVGKTLGKHTVKLSDVEAFGKKSAKLLQLIPRRVFKEQNLQPIPGLEITVDNQTGIIRTVSGGRVIVDFNHPLASKDIIYEIDIKSVVHEADRKIASVLDLAHIPYNKVSVTDNKAVISGKQELPSQLIEIFAKDITRLTGVTDVKFTTEQKA